MDDVQVVVRALVDRGWSLAAIADELGVHAETVMRWKAGSHQPTNTKPVILVLEGLLKRQRVPKRKRYTKSPPARES